MDLSYEQNIKRFARANTNIALVKYWGKKDETLKIPFQSSLSMTLDALYTDTGMLFHEGKEDIFYLNGVLQDRAETHKISCFLDLFREKTQNYNKIFISSYNNFPTAAGLASSSSGYAALTVAANDLFGLELESHDLSKMARLGSGSACRSLFGGFVTWNCGSDHDSSYAMPFADASDYAMLILLIDTKRKKQSSTYGMKQVVEESVFYPAWVAQAEKDFEAMKQAILAKDFTAIGKIAEANCLKMHATTWGVKEPFSYLLPESYQAIEHIREIRQKGLEIYFTMDAGANVKVFCKKADLPEVMKKFKKYYPLYKLLPSGSGNGSQMKECEQFGQDEGRR